MELRGVVRRMVVTKKKKMMSRIKKTKQTVMEMMDVAMEIMALMIIMTKNQQKKVNIRGNQDLLLTIWLNQKKKPTLLGFIKQLPKDFQSMILQKQKKIKTRKRKRMTVHTTSQTCLPTVSKHTKKH